MKVAIYLRVSTEEQAKEGFGLGAQREKAVAYANLYDLSVVEVIEDAGQSAKSLNRPGLQRVLRMLRTGKAEGVVICKLDRLTRSVADWQLLIDGYFGERAGKQLFSVADSIDTRTAAGRMVLNILLSVAQWERETIGERTRDALQHKIRNGERCGNIRFGYDFAPDGVLLIPNAAEQEALTIMRELRQNNQTLQAIADELTRRGVPTKEGGTWQRATISQILKRATSAASTTA